VPVKARVAVVMMIRRAVQIRPITLLLQPPVQSMHLQP
jgi:hypothetical protein